MKRDDGNAISRTVTCFTLTIGGLLATSCSTFAFDEGSDSVTGTKSNSVDVTVHSAIGKATVGIRPADRKGPNSEIGILLKGSEPNRTIVLCRGGMECEVGDEFQVGLADLQEGVSIEQRWVDAVCIFGGPENRLFSLLSVGDSEAEERATSLSSELPEVNQELLVYGLHASDGSGQKLSTETVKVLKLQQFRYGSPWHDCICEKTPTSVMTYIVAVFDTNGRFTGIRSPVVSVYRNPEIAEGRIAITSAVDIADNLKDHGVAVPEFLLTATLQRRIERAHSFRPVSSDNVTISWSDHRDELQGQSGKTGKWSMLKIPRQDFIIPIVGANMAAVMVGKSLAAYSAECGRWDVLEVAGIDKKGVAVEDNSVKVFVGKEKRFYVFSSKSGEWTSPTDPDYRPAEEVLHVSLETARRCMEVFKDTKASLQVTNGTMKVCGTKRRVDDVVRKIREIEAAEVALKIDQGRDRSSSSTLSTKNSLAEQQSLALAKSLRNGEASTEQRAQLRSLVARSLDHRFVQQRKLAQQLEERFRAIQTALQSRKQNRDRIIDRRLEELLDPSVEWQTLTERPKAVHGMPATGMPAGLTRADRVPSTTQSPSEIVSHLIERRKSAESAAGEVRNATEELERWLAPLESILETYGNDPDIDAAHRLRVIKGNTQSVKDQQQALRDRMAEWRIEWQSYLSEIRHKGLILNEKQLKLDQHQETLARMTGDKRPKGLFAPAEIRKAESAVSLARIEAKHAEEAMKAFSAIEKDALHLNPSNFDLTALLAAPKTIVNDSSPVKNARPAARIPMPDIARMESTAEIVNELGTRRRLAELVAHTLNGHLAQFRKYSQPLETLQADGFDGDEGQRQAGITSARSSIHHDQKDLPHMMSAWSNAWRAYQGHITHRRLNLEEKKANLQLAELKLKQLERLQQETPASNVEVKQGELKLKLGMIEVDRAKEELAVFEAIATDSPQLDPNRFDTSKLLADPETGRLRRKAFSGSP